MNKKIEETGYRWLIKIVEIIGLLGIILAWLMFHGSSF